MHASRDIPIRSLMPQPDDGVEFMPMPREMSTFEMPRLPEPGPGNDIAARAMCCDSFASHFDAWLDAAATAGAGPASAWRPTRCAC